MPNDQEIIEARLAAYVEGDLPPAERTEIEKYLVANPQHAQLIKDLQAQRPKLRALPRERAPAEVLDHLQSHLERSALLENVEDAAESMRIRRWPQLVAVAAMLLLAVGLGALVYQVLPSGNNPTLVTLAPPALQQLPSSPSLKKESLARNDDADTLANVDGRLSEPRGRDFVEQMADQMAAASEKAKQQGPADAQPQLPPGESPVQASPMAPSPAPAPASIAMAMLNNSSAIVVETDDALITQNLVAGYLAQNKFNYEAVQAADAFGNAPAPTTGPVLLAGIDGVAQQSIGNVVNKLRTKDDAPAKDAPPAEEAYLLARNVPADKAAEITRALAAQRGGRQQARFYSNAELYPELQLQVPANNLTQQSQQQRSLPQNASEGNAPTTQQNNAPLVQAPAANALPVAELASRVAEPADASTTQPTTQPALDAAATTDLLIVVRSGPEIAAPLMTPPAGAGPTPAVVPAAVPDAEPLTPPTTAPATQPATAPSENLLR